MAEHTDPPTNTEAESLAGAPHEGQMVTAPPIADASAADDTAAETKGDQRASRQMLTGHAARQMKGEPQLSLTPTQLAWRQLRKNRFAVAGGIVLIVLYTIALFAPFISPYDPQDKSPGNVADTRYHPPMRLRWTEANGQRHWRPFVYQTQEKYNEFRELVYLADPTKPQVMRFFVRGAPYKLFGLIPTTIHLYGVENGAAVFLLGTDEQGRDYLSRLLYGSQISLSVGLIAIAITFTLGMLVGGISGFYGGTLDDLIMRGCEIMMSVPDFYLLLALASALPVDPSPAGAIRTYILIIAILSFVGWAGMARIVRGMVLSVREREYVEAAHSLGVSDFKIITRHILPSTFTYAIVAATMSVPGYILGEAGLSFLGLGIRDPMASWGNMLEAARNLSTLQTRPWILAPGFMIFITTLAFNFLGDGLRDALDPKSRRLG